MPELDKIQAKIKSVFSLLRHDQGMVMTYTTSAPTQTKGYIVLGQSCLQAYWNESAKAPVGYNNAETANVTQNHPDRRLSVCNTGCVSKKSASEMFTPESGPAAGHGQSDSLLGSLLAESFVTAVFGPLLPFPFLDFSLFDAMETADTVWLDRRETNEPAVSKSTPRSYFPLYSPAYC